jgi:sugar lactone lactonase YvrE/dienelactone hydrolase
MNARVRCLVILALIAGSSTLPAQSDPSPLWGSVSPGPHRVGFKTLRVRDGTRGGGAADTASRASERGYPIVIAHWYPAAPNASGRVMTFGAYQTATAVDEGLRDVTPEQRQQADRQLKAFYERAQNFPFGPVEEERWARLGPTKGVAIADAAPTTGSFPLIIGVGGPGGNFVNAEYLASHGYFVALVFSPAQIELSPAARMEWFVRDLEFAQAHLRQMPGVDTRRVGTWGFSFAGMPALLAGMRMPGVAAVASLESGTFSPQFSQQLVANPFYAPANLRVPLLHMMRAQLSRDSERLEGFEALRYAARIRYLLNDTSVVHQDFGTHGMAAAAILGKRPAALSAAREAQRANAEYIRRFFDAHVKRDESAVAWLARSPEANGFSRGAVTIEHRTARQPAPTTAQVIAWINAQGARAAMDRFREAQRSDPEAAVFQEAAMNAFGYQLLNGVAPAASIDVFRMNTELYPRSANVWDSLSEAYEITGDLPRALEFARKTLDALPGDTTVNDARRAQFRQIQSERIARLTRPPGAAPPLMFPSGVTLDAAGNVFFADRSAHVVFRIDARSSELTVFAGTGIPGRSGDGGQARTAQLRSPEWVEFDSRGNLYVADRGNHVIRKIDPSGIITHVAGTGVQAQSGDGGPAATAEMTNPFGLTLDRSGNIFFFDTEVHAIRRIDARTGIVTTVIGNKQQGFGGDGGPATQAMLFRPHNGVFDRDGALIFGDSFNQRIRRWDPATGIIETIAGTGQQGTSPSGTPARQAKFTFFGGMVVDRAGDLLVTGLDHRIIKLDRRAGVLNVVAGTGVAGFSGDGQSATSAQFATPYGIALAANGDIIVADAGNARVRRIDAATGVIRTIAGQGAAPLGALGERRP